MFENLARRSFLAVLAAAAFTLGQQASAQDGRSVKTYIALGDSVAFGATDVLPVSFGDQGYVKPYADWLSTQFDGVRPNVVNLGIFGETSSSFFSGVTSPYWPFRYPETNLNYTDRGVAQFAKFLKTVEAEKAARHDVKVVSFALGANDLFALSQTPEWNAPGADPFALLEPVLAEVEANYIRLLDALRAELPHAKVLLPNYYNAYEVLGPYDPTYILYEYVVLRHDEMVQRLAAEYKAHRVDVHSAFQGHALEYTNIAFGNIHPTPLGYEVFAQAMIAASNN